MLRSGFLNARNIMVALKIAFNMPACCGNCSYEETKKPFREVQLTEHKG